MRLVLLLSILFLGCVTAPKNTIPTTEIQNNVQPDQCFTCEGKNFLPISYGTVAVDGHILYGLPVKEWRYHCLNCRKPTTGDKKRDEKLQRKQLKDALTKEANCNICED